MIFLFSFFRFLFALFIVASIGVITGRELKCDFGTDEDTLWPEFQYCKLFQVDLSESYESHSHSFTGSSSQKSETVVHFDRSPKVDFVPKQILKEFSNLNGLKFESCNLSVFKNDLFPADFVVLEFLYFFNSQIASIEPFAFQNLKNLKWLSLSYNKIQSLPFNLFQNNPKLIYLDFEGNQINSISPHLLKNLNQLEQVDFWSNRCVNEGFGCDWCSQSISDLDSDLSTCFRNCLEDPECATKSELVQGTIQTTPQVTTTPKPKIEDLPASSSQNNARANNPNPTLQSLEPNLAQELANFDITTESPPEVERTETVTPNSTEIEETEPQDLKLFLEGIDEKMLNMTEDLRVALATKIGSENEAIKNKIEETNKLSHEILEKLNKILAGKINCGLENANELLTALLENEKLKVKILKAELLQKKMEKELKNLKLQSKGNLKQ